MLVGCSDNSESTIETMEEFVDEASEVPTQKEADQKAADEIDQDNASEELEKLRAEIKRR